MTDRVEAQGKTVKEAVSEALLKMGARENEVKVTVLEQPKSGLFGFLGGKPAKVLIEKRGSRDHGGRRPNQNDNHSGHGFGDSGGSDKRRGRNPRRSTGTQSKERQEPRETRPASPRAEKKESTGGGSGQRRRGSRGRGGAPVKKVQQEARTGRDTGRTQEQRTPVASSTSSTSSKSSSDNRSRTSERRPTSTVSNENRGRRNMNRNRYQHNDSDMVLDKNNPHLDEQRKHFEAAERSRLQEESSKNVNGNLSEAPVETSDSSSNGNANSNSRSSSRRNDNRQDSRSRSRGSNRGGGSSRSNDRPARDERPSPVRERQEPQVPDEMIIQGLVGVKYGEALSNIPVEESNPALEKVTNELFKLAGFPCNCEVVEDEYSLVKIVTDDASAGMLIGRHGSTVDAIEHLVERMTCNAVGERVRMNLDINNYRQRREEALVERVADAVQNVLSSGRPYHIEPQDARERRMVHMEALKTEGLRTYTMYGSGGKHVVIALDDKPKDSTQENAQESAPLDDVVEVESTQADSFDDGINTEENPAP